MGFVTNRWQPVNASPGPTPVVPVRYGIKFTQANASTITYLYDAVGFTPASMNFTTGVFNWGSWANTPLVQSIYPIVTSSGSDSTTVGYKLNPNNLTQKIDGTPIDNPLTGNVATVFEGGWIHTEYDSSVTPTTYTIVWSNIQWDSTYQAYHRMNHNNSDGTVYSSFALGIYCDTGLGTKSAVNWFQYNYIISLLRIIGKTTHVLDTFGTGYTGSFTKGIGDTAGAFYGFNKTSTASTDYSKIFYLEQFLAGANAIKGLRGAYPDSSSWYYTEFNYNGAWVHTNYTYTNYVHKSSSSGSNSVAFNRINGYSYINPYGLVPYYYGNPQAYSSKGTDWPLWDFEANFPIKTYRASYPSYLYLNYTQKTTTHLTLAHSSSATEYSSGKRTVQFIT